MPVPIALATEKGDAQTQDRWRNHAANNDGEPEKDFVREGFVDLHGG
jgi:hypothetical protein